MTHYARKPVPAHGEFDVEGTIIEVLAVHSNTLEVLVEVPEGTTTTATAGGDDPGVVDENLRKQTYYCLEPKADDEPCGREVENPEDTCWQHND